MKTVLRVLAYLRRYPFMASAQLLCAIVGTLMVVVLPGVTSSCPIISGNECLRLVR